MIRFYTNQEAPTGSGTIMDLQESLPTMMDAQTAAGVVSILNEKYADEACVTHPNYTAQVEVQINILKKGDSRLLAPGPFCCNDFKDKVEMILKGVKLTD